MSDKRLTKSAEDQRAEQARAVAQPITLKDVRRRLLEIYDALAPTEQTERQEREAGSSCSTSSTGPFCATTCAMKATDLQNSLAHLAPGETLLLPAVEI